MAREIRAEDRHTLSRDDWFRLVRAMDGDSDEVMASTCCCYQDPAEILEGIEDGDIDPDDVGLTPLRVTPLSEH